MRRDRHGGPDPGRGPLGTTERGLQRVESPKNLLIFGSKGKV